MGRICLWPFVTNKVLDLVSIRLHLQKKNAVVIASTQKALFWPLKF